MKKQMSKITSFIVLYAAYLAQVCSLQCQPVTAG